jgi:hypothetical protein
VTLIVQTFAFRQRLSARSTYCLPPENGAEHTHDPPARQPLNQPKLPANRRIFDRRRQNDGCDGAAHKRWMGIATIVRNPATALPRRETSLANRDGTE